MPHDNTVRVWDPLVRIFHWSLVAAFVTVWLSAEEVMWLHAWAGYAIAGLVGFRLLWGVAGPHHARFSNFVRSPAAALGHLRDLVTGRATRHVGHNPAGGAMVVALLVALTLTAVAGMTLYGAKGHGPLAGIVPAFDKSTRHLIKEVHEFLANGTLVLVGLHVAGVIASSIAHRENLVRAMFTGRKPA